MQYVYIGRVFFGESRKIYSFLLLLKAGRFFCGFLILIPSCLPLAHETPFIGMDV